MLRDASESYLKIIRSTESMLEEIGVTKVINCAGTLTVLGGTTVDPEVIDSMKEIAGFYVDMPEFHRKVGEYLARMIGCESAFVVNGAEAGLVISLAACMTRGDLRKMTRLPDARGMRDEYIVQRLHRNMYDSNLRLTGATLVEIGGRSGTSEKDLERAINSKTAAVVYFVYDPQRGVLPLDVVCRIAHGRRVPVIADAAAELPPVENLTKFLKMGADLAVFSGGKDIGAPNDTGLIVGRKDLVDACMRLGPHSYESVGSQVRVFIGRPMKTSKEDVIAFVAAMKRYLRMDHAKRFVEWSRKTEYMVSELEKLGEKVRVIRSEAHQLGQLRPAGIPRIQVELVGGGLTAERLIRELKEGTPSIVAYSDDGRLGLSPQCLGDGEEEIVISRLKGIISRHERSS